MNIIRLAIGLATLGASEVLIFTGKCFTEDVDDIDAHNRQYEIERSYEKLIRAVGRKRADEIMRENGYGV